MGIKDDRQLYAYPKLGSFWEGFALEEVIRTFNIPSEHAYFWATQAHAELDLLLMKDNKKIGFEFKYMDAPKLTKSMRIAQQDLKLDHLAVLYPGDKMFPLGDSITAYGLELIASDQLVKNVLKNSA